MVDLFRKTSPIAKKTSPIIKKTSSITQKTTSDVQKILIYQHEDYHSEIAGFIIQNCISFDIDVYYPNINSTNNCFGYYSKIFNKKINYVTCSTNIKLYHRVFVLTNKEIIKIKHDNLDIKNMILFKHINIEDSDQFKDYMNISFIKMIRANICMLPIYHQENKSQKRQNIISIIGNMSSPIVRDLSGILLLGEDDFIKKNYTIQIYTRKIDKIFMEKISKMRNIKIYMNCDTNSLLNNIRGNKFLLTADTDYYRKVGPNYGVMTGIIPLGLNNEIPLIMSNELNNIYGLQGTIKYNNIKDIINTLKNMTDSEYSHILREFIKGKNEIIQNNRKIMKKLI